MFQRVVVVAVLTTLSACSRDSASEPALAVGHTSQALFTNGDFESSPIGQKPPTGWTLEKYLNDNVSPLAGGATTNNLGLAVVPPQKEADLNLTANAGGLNGNAVGAATTGGAADLDVPALRYPRFGLRSVVVNPGNANQGPTDLLPTGRNRSGNALTQTMTLSASDIDPFDNQVHIRFVAAPALQNPGHADYEQPYFYVVVKNVTRGTQLYSNFNFAGQPGVNWQTQTDPSGDINYTDWQLIDVAPGDAASIGDQIQMKVYAVGCSRRGHWGRVYVDSFGPTIPGLFITGVGPASAPNNTDVTYTLTYRNNSGNTINGTTVHFTTPPNTTFVGTTGPSCSGLAAGAAGTMTCNVGTVANQGNGTFTVTLHVTMPTTPTLLTAQNYDITGTGVSPLIGSKIDTLIYTGPATLTAVSGTPQSATVNTSFGQDLVVRARDANNANLVGLRIDFTPPASGASSTFPIRFGITDQNGEVRVHPTANTVAGAYNVVAAASGITSTANFALTNTAGAPASLVVVSGTPQSATRLTAFANPLVVEVRDQYGNPVPGATVSFTPPASGATASLSAPATTGANGRTQVTATAGSTAGTYSVTATVGGVATPVTFTLTNTAGPAASITVSAGNNQSTAVTTAFATPLRALVRDAGNNVIQGATVTWAAPGAGASAGLSSASTTTDASGLTSVTATANTVAGGPYVVTASTPGVATPASFSLTNTPGAPASVTVVSGSPQSTTVNTTFGAPLVVVVKDAQGNVVPNATVTFTAPGAGASASVTTTVTTGSTGQASTPATANTAAGTYAVTAAVTGVTGTASFTLTNTAGPATTLVRISGSPQSAVVTTAFAAPLVVEARDAFANPVPGASVAFTAPSTGARATLSAATVTTGSTGRAQVTATAGTVTGTYNVTASGASSVTFSLTNTAGAPASLTVISGTPQSTAVTTAFAQPLVVEVKDAQGNVVPGVSVAFAAPSTGARASLSGATATTGSNGRAQVTATAGTVAGSYAVTASVTGVAGTGSFALTNTPGAPASVTVISGSPQSTAVNTAFAAPLVVEVRDAQGNVVPNATVTFTTPGSGASAAVTTTVTTDSSGRASTTATANGTPGSYSVTATVGGVGTGGTFALTNTAGAPASLTVISGTPQSTAVTTAFAQPLVVEVKDALGNVVPGVTVTFTPPASGATATPSSATATTGSDGRAQVTATAGTVAGGPYLVQASVTGVTATGDFSLTNTPGAPASVTVVSGASQSTPTNAAFPQPLVVVVKDAQGNVIPNATVTFTAPGSGASAAVTTTVTTDASGQATTPATANGTAGSYDVTATVSGVTTPATFPLTNVAVPTALNLESGGGQSATVTAAFAHPLVFRVTDLAGNGVANVRVDLGTPATGATAALSSTSLFTDTQGRVSVDATANTRAGTYEVTASSTSLTDATAALTNTPGEAVAVNVVSGGTQSTVAGTAFPAPLVVEAVDAWGNPVPGATLTWSAPGTGASATLSDATVTTDSNGRATITATANQDAGTYPVTVRLPGGQQADFVLTNTPAGGLVLTVSSGSGQSTEVATAFPQPLVAKVEQNGAPLANAVVTFLVPTAGQSATLTSATATTNAQGLASVPATANTRAGSYDVRATTPNAAQDALFHLTNTPGAPAALIPAPGSSPQSTQVNSDFGAPLTLTVVDQYGNPVPNVDVTFDVPGSGPSASLDHTTVTSDANGNVVVQPTANGTAGTYDVTATVTGLTQATFTLTNTTGQPLVVTIVSGSPQSATVDTAFALPLQVRVTQGGSPVSGATVTWTTPATDPSATVSAATSTTDATGLAQVDATAGQRSGHYEVTASVQNGVGPARFQLTNTAGAPATITAFAASTPQSTLVSTAFPQPLVVTVTDAFMNPVPGAAVTFVAPSAAVTAVLTASPPATDGNGQASVTAIASADAGTYDVTATVAGVTAPATFTLTNLDSPTPVIALSGGDAQSTIATTAFPQPLTVDVHTGSGQPLGNTAVTVELPATGPSATASSTTLTTDAQGHASVTLTANATPGVFDAKLTVAGAAAPALAHLTITPIPTTTTVTVTPDAPSLDTPATLSAKVTSDHGVPQGVVHFSVDGDGVGTATLLDGTATLGPLPLPVGHHEVTATYDRQGAFDASSAAATGFDVGADLGSLNGGGGCSCTTSGGSHGLDALLLLLGVGLVARRRGSARWLRRGAGGLVVALLLLVAPRASAQATNGVSLNVFHPAAAGSDWFSTDSLDLRGTVRPSVMLLFDYAHNPLVVYNADGSIRSIAVANQAWLNLGGSLVLFDRVRLAVNVPLAVHTGSFNASFNGQSVRPASNWGFGDISLAADVRLFGAYREPFTLALGALLTAPSGAADSFLGEGRVTVTPRLQVAGEVSRFQYAVNVAYAFRGGSLAGVPYGNELRYGGSAGLLFFERKLLIGPELHGFVDFDNLSNGRQPALEVDLGAHLQLHPDWRLSAGVGTGLTKSPGVPDYRILASLGWAPHYEAPVTDRDGDGVLDPDDLCPDVPQGEHPDVNKRGCPTPDTDGDGILDDVDVCPTVHQGEHPDPRRTGCPEPDSDHDGLLDSVDACPTVAQGPVPDPKKPGCPDPDADLDGVTDSQDLCVKEPAGARPDPERKGCPLPDRDGDFIADAKDACPDKPGAPNPDPKKNGCPGLVKLEGSKILILQPVNFATNKDVILASSFKVLTAVRDTLNAFPEIQRLSIEGHTDSQGKAAYNKDLSERRAQSVLRWLTENGIDPTRLEAHGYGQEQPIDSNKTAAGRAKNRRVEFKILKREGE